MKYFFVFLIKFYQIFLSPLLHTAAGTKNACRYPITCSEYALEKIREHGVFKGGVLALKRLSTCHPFAR